MVYDYYSTIYRLLYMYVWCLYTAKLNYVVVYEMTLNFSVSIPVFSFNNLSLLIY